MKDQPERFQEGAPPPGAALYRPAQRQRLGDQLYEQILQRIVSGEYGEGARLPSEAQLCRAFKVSRSVVREALSRLHVDGLVNARQGAGTFVQHRPSVDFLEHAPAGAIADVLRFFEMRIALEGEAAFHAASRRSRADIARITAINQRLETMLVTRELGVDVDIELHEAIAGASQNALFVTALRDLRPLFDAGLQMSRSLSLKKEPIRLRLVQDEHESIVSAIVEGSPDRARTAMRHHIENARIRMISGAKSP
jgi:DNA-binding FadR family transcriptional regulator